MDARLVEMMRMIEQDLTQNGRTEIAQRLSQVRAQAEIMAGANT